MAKLLSFSSLGRFFKNFKKRKLTKSRIKILNTNSKAQESEIWNILLISTLTIYIIFVIWMFITPNYLWLDEVKYAWLSLNWSWFKSAWYTPTIGWAVLVSVLLNILNNDYTVKLLSVLVTIGTIVFVYWLVKKMCTSTKRAFLVFISLFAMYPLWRYAVELNQYSMDMFIQSILIYGAFRLFRERLSIKKFGIISAIVVWFSRPAVYTIAAVFVAYFAKIAYENVLYVCITKKGVIKTKAFFSQLKDLLIGGLYTGISWIIFYITRAHIVMNSASLKGYWKASMGFRFVTHNLRHVIKEPFTHTMQLEFLWPIFLLIIIFGVLYLIYKKWFWFALSLTLPTVFALLSTMLYKFPWNGRLLSFLTLQYVLFAGFGLVFLGDLASAGVRCFFRILAGFKVFNASKTIVNKLASVAFYIPILIVILLFSRIIYKNVLLEIYKNKWGSDGFGYVIKEVDFYHDPAPKWVLMWGRNSYKYYGRCNINKCDDVKYFPYHKRGQTIDPVEFSQYILEEVKTNKTHSLWLISAHLSPDRREAMQQLCGEVLKNHRDLEVVEQVDILNVIACKVKLKHIAK